MTRPLFFFTIYTPYNEGQTKPKGIKKKGGIIMKKVMTKAIWIIVFLTILVAFVGVATSREVMTVASGTQTTYFINGKKYGYVKNENGDTVFTFVAETK